MSKMGNTSWRIIHTNLLSLGAWVAAVVLACSVLAWNSVLRPGTVEAASGSDYKVAGAQAVLVKELAEKGRGFDGKKVTITGEVIGEVMYRGNYAWVNVLDPSGAIGVFMPADMARAIGSVGGYFRTGDIVRITGTFSISCKQHNGEPDIHAEEMIVVQEGKPIPHRVSPERVISACALTALAVTLGYRAWKLGRLL